jgi:SagB-type dehydrogenase family enzyme
MQERKNMKADITLPPVDSRGATFLEEILRKRESWRRFSPEPLTNEEVARMMWAAQGVTRTWGGRTAPSAGALFPLEIYVVLEEGVHHYIPRKHQLLHLSGEDVREALCSAALSQAFIRDAPATVVIAVVFERVTVKYGSRGERYAMIEAGHAAQNILLQATSMGLGSVPVGAFHDERVRQVLDLPDDHRPVYLVTVGHRLK